MMEFEEMKKVWNTQKGEAMYLINETALQKIVTRRKNAASKRINSLEVKLSIINSTVAFILLILIFNQPNILLVINFSIVLASIVVIQYFRTKRQKAENRFDRSIIGELDHAIANTNSIIRFNHLVLLGYFIPLFIICFTSLFVKGASLEKWLLMTAAFLLGSFLIRWEQRVRNLPLKKELLALKKKLMED